MPLGRRREAFDHSDWLFELKWEGFRTLAYVTGGGSKLVSRNDNAFRSFPDLAAELALEVNSEDAILDRTFPMAVCQYLL
jgi:ATP-dependent DNA ligase